MVAGKDAYEGRCRVIFQEPLIWAMGENADVSLEGVIPLVMQPSPCHFRKLATENLEKEGRKWEIIYTATSTAGIQTAVQAGIGLSVLPLGALKAGMKKAPARLKLPELPTFSIALFKDEKKKNDAGDYFIRYLEAELNNQ